MDTGKGWKKGQPRWRAVGACLPGRLPAVRCDVLPAWQGELQALVTKQLRRQLLMAAILLFSGFQRCIGCAPAAPAAPACNPRGCTQLK